MKTHLRLYCQCAQCTTRTRLDCKYDGKAFPYASAVFIDGASAFRATLVSEQLSQRTLKEKGQSDSSCCQGQEQACEDGGCCSSPR